VPTTTRPRVGLLLAASLCAALWTSPALGAGTGGIEVTPVPAIVDGKQVTAFHATLPASGRTSVRFALRNITTESRTARVYAAVARADGQGGFSIGDAGSSPHVRLTDRTVTLKAKETRVETFEVLAPKGERPDGTVHAAVVLESQRGSVVQRAATLIYLEPGERDALPVWARYVAAILLVLVIVGVVLVVGSRRRRRPLFQA
jgi:hypothetical protein